MHLKRASKSINCCRLLEAGHQLRGQIHRRKPKWQWWCTPCITGHQKSQGAATSWHMCAGLYPYSSHITSQNCKCPYLHSLVSTTVLRIERVRVDGHRQGLLHLVHLVRVEVRQPVRKLLGKVWVGFRPPHLPCEKCKGPGTSTSGFTRQPGQLEGQRGKQLDQDNGLLRGG